MPPAIRIEALEKRYGAVHALRGLDLEVPRGSITALVGRNGAGKTTTLRILLGMTRSDGGTVELLGDRVADERASIAARRRIAFVDAAALYPAFTVAQVAAVVAGAVPCFDGRALARGLDALELPRDRTVRALSTGMRARLALLLACCRRPELLVLDEPTEGLDPVMREDALAALLRLNRAEGTTVLFSSHVIAEVAQVAHRVCVVERGRAALAGDVDALVAEWGVSRAALAHALRPWMAAGLPADWLSAPTSNGPVDAVA